MEGRTARSIRRLMQSPDFNELIKYFDDLEKLYNKQLILSTNKEDMFRLQGKLLLLNKFSSEVADSEKIAKL